MIGSDQLPEDWIKLIADWAASEPLILEAYVFGSRAKGIAQRTSDLDVAVLVRGRDEGERDGHWICESSRWKADLSKSVPVAIDLWSIGEDDQRVRPAVIEHGVIVFRR